MLVSLAQPHSARSSRRGRRTRAVIAAAAFPLLTSTVVLAQFDAPADYYNPVDTATAISNPAQFKDQIHDRITSDYFTAGSTAPKFRSYDDARQGLVVTDRDPND